MPRHVACSRVLDMRCKIFGILFIVAVTTTACSTMPWHREPPKPNPLITANCPDLTPLSDDSFGATSLKLIEVAGIYYRCREAALSARP